MINLKQTKSKDILKGTSFNVFCTEQFLSSQSNEFGWIYNDEFLIPFYLKKKYIFTYITFTSDAISLTNQIEKERKESFLNSIISDLPKLLKIDFILCPPTFVLFEFAPLKSKSCSFGSEKFLWSGQKLS